MHSGWENRRADGRIHILPVGDLRPHVETASCWCRPTDLEFAMRHNSMDLREEYERGRRPS